MDIVVDLDQTLFPLLLSMKGVKGGSRVHTNCPRWDALRDLCDEPLLQVIERAIEPEHALSVGLYPDAKEALESWEASGLQIMIATHRHSRYRRETEEFLKGSGLDFPLAIGEEVDKTSLLGSNGILIDDAPHILERAALSGFRSATLLHAYNKDAVRAYQIPSARRWNTLRSLILP